MSEPCVCGHDEKDHDDEEDECREVCPCAGYTTKLADSNLPWHHELVKAQARIAELLQEIERLRTTEDLIGQQIDALTQRKP